MPPKKAFKPSSKAKPTTARLDDYLLDGDLSDFDGRSPTPPADSVRRKEASGLGIDEEVEVKKRAYVPRVKLDETRLLSKAGIPTLRQRAKQLRLRGKGHEWSDASKLLSLYQLWLDDLFPKAKFLDALAMVEKAGHKTGVVKARLGWIDEGKPKTASMFDVDEEDVSQEAQEVRAPSRIAPIFEQPKSAGDVAADHRLKTPDIPDEEDLFGDEGIYDATPRAKAARDASGDDKLDEDDLDALMAEAEASTDATSSTNRTVKSIFGGPASEGPSRSTSGPGLETQSAITRPAPEEPDEDDLDALMAEGEQDSPGAKPVKTVGKPDEDSFADDEEAMAEMDGLW